MGFKVGDTVWLFDLNSRVYVPGRSAPVYRGHFVPHEIVGETSKSWIVGFGEKKFPKKNPEGMYTAEGVDDQCWAQDYRIKIIDHVRRCSPDQLREIAKIVGFVAPE